MWKEGKLTLQRFAKEGNELQTNRLQFGNVTMYSKPFNKKWNYLIKHERFHEPVPTTGNLMWSLECVAELISQTSAHLWVADSEGR